LTRRRLCCRARRAQKVVNGDVEIVWRLLVMLPVPHKAGILIYHCLPFDEVPRIQAKPGRERPRAR
jgi:hypothetical protein